jgi:hypothetical protein
MGPPKDPFRLPSDASFTKGEVNRSGDFLEAFNFKHRPPGAGAFEGVDIEAFVKAMYAITWWKQQHARPLSRVAASLRYHVVKEDGSVGDRIDVAQRLKKRDTIIGKLHRFENMKLTQMHDIGGVRATFAVTRLRRRREPALTQELDDREDARLHRSAQKLGLSGHPSRRPPRWCLHRGSAANRAATCLGQPG